MTDPIRGMRQRRNGRRPGWVLLTVLLVLAIVASSALVFTDKVELLKLAVIISLWAAVVAAFISFIYRRQADLDQARARDLKLVYDLQLDREISARREYELSVESHLRRELGMELRAQASDEVASLRAELAALRANLEIIFDADLQHRPALEHEPQAGQSFGRVISSRIDEDPDDSESNTEESAIIDVPEEPQPADPHPSQPVWEQSPVAGGAHRRASERMERDAAPNGWRPVDPPPAPSPSPGTGLPWPPPEPPPAPAPPVTPQPVQTPPVAPQPAPAPPIRRPESDPQAEPEPRRPAPVFGDWSPAQSATPPATPAMAPPPADPRRSRHASSEFDDDAQRRARHSVSDTADPGRPIPTLAAPPQPTTPPEPTPTPPEPPEQPRRSRHRSDDEPEPPTGQHAGGQPLSELLARLQTPATSEGGRRRRRDE